MQEVNQYYNQALAVIDQFDQNALARYDNRMEQSNIRISELEAAMANTTGIAREKLASQIESERKALDKLEQDKEDAEKKQAKRNKAFAIGQAAINTALAVTNIIATAIDPTGLTTAIRVAAAIALGTAQIAAIAATPVGEKGLSIPMYEKGGAEVISGGRVGIGQVAKGRRHSAGGILVGLNKRLFEIEDGEFTDIANGKFMTINRRSTSLYGSQLRAMAGIDFEGKDRILSAINQAGGGIPLAAQGMAVPIQGGKSIQAQNNSSNMGQIIQRVMQSVIVAVPVQQVTNKQNEINYATGL